jgi:hypothetical protein
LQRFKTETGEYEISLATQDGKTHLCKFHVTKMKKKAGTIQQKNH